VIISYIFTRFGMSCREQSGNPAPIMYPASRCAAPPLFILNNFLSVRKTARRKVFFYEIGIRKVCSEKSWKNFLPLRASR
jgi:hypothetical protein